MLHKINTFRDKLNQAKLNSEDEETIEANDVLNEMTEKYKSMSDMVSDSENQNDLNELGSSENSLSEVCGTGIEDEAFVADTEKILGKLSVEELRIIQILQQKTNMVALKKQGVFERKKSISKLRKSST